MTRWEELEQLRDRARARGIPVARSQTFRLLLDTVRSLNPERILEIGTAVGCSAAGMLLAAPRARLTGIELQEDCCREARENLAALGCAERALIHNGDASEIIPVLSGTYDFIFLDGPKGHYFEYLPFLKPLLPKGGILFADNVSFFGYADGERKAPRRHNTIVHSLMRFVEALKNDGEMETSVVAVEDGVLIAKKR